MNRRLALLTSVGSIVLVMGAGGSYLAASTGVALPPEKQKLEDDAAAHRLDAWVADKAKDPGRPEISTEERAIEGILSLDAPISGAAFTAENAWVGWLDETTYARVWAGAPASEPDHGLVLIMIRAGKGGIIDESVEPVGKLIEVPKGSGPLRIVGASGGTVTVADPAGNQSILDVSAERFE